jgi:C1A family cysteine protease
MAKKKAPPPQDLAAAIRSRGYEWQAGPTSLSNLSPAEQKAHLGLVVRPEELQATEQAIKALERVRALAAVAFAAPPSIDWRNNNGNWTTPIKDQGSCGSCVSFATCATFESRLKIACKNASFTPDLSEAHLFYCGCGNCCGTGWNFAPALDFCKQTGVAKEADFPYTPGNKPCPPGLTAYSKLTAWVQVLAVADRKDRLSAKGPMVAGLAVFADFYSYKTGVYRHVTGALQGYHAVSVVGYDDTQQCWICKNSWGPAWGDSGWFKIGYGECGIDTQFAFYDLDAPCPEPTPTPENCRQYVPILVRVLQVARTNAALRACLRYYVCGIGQRPRCTPQHIAVVKGVLSILKKCPQYRRAFCNALR